MQHMANAARRLCAPFRQLQDADLKGKGMADRSGDCTGEEFNTAIGSLPLPTHVPF